MRTPSLHEMRPNDSAWVEIPSVNPLSHEAVLESWWQLGTLRVGSALAHAKLPKGDGDGLQWIVSISENGRRPSRVAVRRALRAFDFFGAEEDNHYPGIARKFWRPVDPAHRVACECKETERTVREPDGYRWTNPTDPAACRGCAYARMTGTPCPLHPPPASSTPGP